MIVFNVSSLFFHISDKSFTKFYFKGGILSVVSNWYLQSSHFNVGFQLLPIQLFNHLSKHFTWTYFIVPLQLQGATRSPPASKQIQHSFLNKSSWLLVIDLTRECSESNEFEVSRGLILKRIWSLKWFLKFPTTKESYSLLAWNPADIKSSCWALLILFKEWLLALILTIRPILNN